QIDKHNFASGGHAGSEVAAMVMGGEYVLNSNAAKSIGYNSLDKMNQTGSLPRFHSGGKVGGPVVGMASGGSVLEELRRALLGTKAESRAKTNFGTQPSYMSDEQWAQYKIREAGNRGQAYGPQADAIRQSKEAGIAKQEAARARAESKAKLTAESARKTAELARAKAALNTPVGPTKGATTTRSLVPQQVVDDLLATPAEIAAADARATAILSSSISIDDILTLGKMHQLGVFIRTTTRNNTTTVFRDCTSSTKTCISKSTTSH
ncbi:unnamed protein product, partial [marine sediment metagenome]